MTSPIASNEEIRRELSQLLAETSQLQKRLQQLQSKLDGEITQPTVVEPTTTKTTPAPLLDYSQQIQQEASTSAEKQIGMRWMVIVGVIALVIACAYEVRIAIQNGWLNEQVRCAAAAVAGLAMFFIGGRIRRRFIGYGEVLMSGGVVAVFIGIYAAHFLYGLVSGEAALGFATLVAFISAVLSWRSQAQSPIYIGLIGAYVAPFLIKTIGTSVAFYFGYLTILNVGYLLLATAFQLLPLQLLALYVSSAMYAWGWWGTFHSQADVWRTALLYQIGHFVCFGLASVLPAVRYHRPLDRTQSIFLLPAILLFYGFGSDLMLQHAESWHLLFGILTGLFVLMVNEIGRRSVHIARAEHFPSVIVTTAVALICCHMITVHQVGVGLSRAVFVWFYLVMAARQLFKRTLLIELLSLFALGFVVVRLNFAFGYATGEPNLAFLNQQFIFLTTVSLTLLYATQKEKQRDAALGELIPFLAHFMVMRGLYLEADRMQIGSFTPFLVTFFWITYSVVVLLYGVWKKSDVYRQQALKLLGFCALKVFLYDTYSSAVEIKAAAYLLLGVVLTVVGYFFQKNRRSNVAQNR